MIRIFQDGIEILQELTRNIWVDGPDVVRQRERDELPHLELALVLRRRHHPRRRAADGQDGGLRRIDDRFERGDAEHAEVGHREGAALELLGQQLLGLGLLRQRAHLLADPGDAFARGAPEDGRDEAVGDGDGDGDVDGLVLQHVAGLGVEGHVDPRVLDERQRDGLEEPVVHGRGLGGGSGELRVDLLAELKQGVDARLVLQVGVGEGALGLLEALRDDLAHVGEGQIRKGWRGRGSGRRRGAW